MQLESFFCHVCVTLPQDKLVARGQMQASLTCPVSGSRAVRGAEGVLSWELGALGPSSHLAASQWALGHYGLDLGGKMQMITPRACLVGAVCADERIH